MSKKSKLKASNINSAQKPEILPKNVSSQKEIEKQPNSSSLKSYAILAGILMITFFTFLKVKDYQFVNWDDDRNFYENTLITTLNAENFWENTKQIFKTDVIGNYNPLPIWTFALENRFRGDGSYNSISVPGKWHMTNLWLHLISVFFAFKISRKLGLGLLGAAFVSLLFGIHPMRVESVAWVTERKDVLFGAFYLAALFCYLKYKETNKIWAIILTYILFIISLFSKIQAVTFPLSLIAIDYLQNKKFEWKSVMSKVPFFALSLLFGIYGILVLGENNSLEGNMIFPLWQRIFVGTYSFVIYLIKLIIPFRLSPLYPYPDKLPTEFYPTILIVPVTLFALYYAYKKSWHTMVFALVFFIFNIFFLLQILGAGQGFLADRFTYIAYFGLFFGLGYLLEKGIKSEKYKIPSIAIAAISVIAYCYITANQVKIWENSGTMWSHVIKYYKGATTPFGNRANYYRGEKQYDLALSDYASAMALKPSAMTYNSRAKLYFDVAGNSRDTLMLALKDYQKAIEMNNTDGEYYINGGAIYARLGDMDKALDYFNKGLKLKPEQTSGYLNRSLVFLNKNMPLEALKDMDEYQKYFPYEANIWYEKGRIKNFLKRYPEAIADLNRSIELDNTKGLYFYERAVTYLNMNNKALAKASLNTSKSLGYKNIDPRFEAAVNQ
jgi:protein O-mannosyl-transferase